MFALVYSFFEHGKSEEPTAAKNTTNSHVLVLGTWLEFKTNGASADLNRCARFALQMQAWMKVSQPVEL